MAQDPYKELGVSRSASKEEIRKAFRNLAKELHPDRNADNKAAEERFKRVTAAFDLLGDEDKRARFDRGEIDADGREVMRGFRGGPGGGGGYGPGPGGAGTGGYGARFDNIDLEDILGEMFGGGGRGGQRGGRTPPPQRGADTRARLEIDLEDAILGASKRVNFGDGRILDVTIPNGAADGQVLRLKGQGQPGRAGPGDAMIELAIRPHPLYRREGGDLHMDLPVGVPDAVLGAKVSAPTPEGAVSLTVPKGSNSGSVLRLKGRGAIDPATGKRGDLFARLMVTLPDEPDAELTKFVEAWRKDRPYTPKRR